MKLPLLLAPLIPLFSMSLGAEQASALAPAAIFSNHMVLQREVKVPVWGTAPAGQTVSVSFQGQTKTAATGADGKWMIRLDEMPAVSEPQKMTIRDSKSSVVFEDVLVGDVWLGSGQSNMEFGTDFTDEFKLRRWKQKVVTKQMGSCVDAQTKKVLMRAVHNPMIRVSSKTRDHLTTPNTGWSLVDETNVITLPALPGCIAVYLQEEIKVPVGIIVRAVSSTATARWVTQEGFLEDPLVKNQTTSASSDPKTKPSLTGTSAAEGFGNLYKAYIEPVRPYALRGFLWDQGEQGIGFRGVNWVAAMHALVTSWRTEWGQGNLPWSATDHYEDTLQANLDKAGLKNFRIAKTDGLSGELHPLNKWRYAQKHLDNIFPMAYQRPAPIWPAAGPGRKPTPRKPAAAP